MDGKLLVWLLQVLWQLVVHGILVALLMGPMSNLWLHHSIVGLEVGLEVEVGSGCLAGHRIGLGCCRPSLQIPLWCWNLTTFLSRSFESAWWLCHLFCRDFCYHHPFLYCCRDAWLQRSMKQVNGGSKKAYKNLKYVF